MLRCWSARVCARRATILGTFWRAETCCQATTGNNCAPRARWTEGLALRRRLLDRGRPWAPYRSRMIAAASYVQPALAADPRPGAGFYDVAQLDDPSVGRCDWLGRERPFVFQESDYIRGY